VFSLFASEEKKMRVNASNWLELAHKVHDYRRDLLPEVLVGELKGQIIGLELLLKEEDNAAKLKLGIEALEEVLRRTGGSIYPRSTLQEYVEFFLVAAIVILGIRTYFVQPFKIPTNSMWPSYFGMTHEVFPTPADEPSPVAKLGRFVAFGAWHYSAVAPVEGDAKLLVFGNGYPAYQEKSGRKWGVLPAAMREYYFRVGENTVSVAVPADFNFERLVREGFLNNSRPLRDYAVEKFRAHQVETSSFSTQVNGNEVRTYWVPLGKRVNRGAAIISFDILTGDQLFVDRISYHFMRPQVGQGFVFRTGNLTELHNLAPGPRDQYYIKRLAGTPGDKLEIRDPILYRNGAPITGAAAFDKNARKEGKYTGYHNEGILGAGMVTEAPKDNFLALGDNSADSLDGRYWGFVPKKDVVGRPLFIYYPFTRRWGPAR